jgi:3-hexulose-6-phosphate synthase
MTPRLWIAYDYTSTSECLDVLDAIVARHPDPQIIHEIGRPTILNAALAGVPIVTEFRKRLGNGQAVVADLKGYDVPYTAEARFYFAAGADIVTVMAVAPDEAIREAINGARYERKLVAFDLMSYQDDDAKVRRALELASMGATLLSCHVGLNEQAAGKRFAALLAKVYREIRETSVQIVAMGGLKPDDVTQLREYVDASKLFAIVAGGAITRSPDPPGAVTAFLEGISRFGSWRAPSR